MRLKYTKIIKTLISKIFVIFSYSWFLFIILHIVFRGKIYLTSISGSIPSIFFVIIPIITILIGVKFIKYKMNLILMVVSLCLGVMQFDISINKIEPYIIDKKEVKKISVFSWNTYFWDTNTNDNIETEKFYDYLIEKNSDIYILQEYLYNIENQENAKLYKNSEKVKICSFIPGLGDEYLKINQKDTLNNKFPGYNISIHNQFVVISKFPILNSYYDSSEQFSVTDIKIDNKKTIRFFNIHMLLHIEPKNPFSSDFYLSMDRRYKARDIGFKNLKEAISNTDEKDYFITGDFNSPKPLGVMDDFLNNHIDLIKFSDEVLPLSFKFNGLKLWRFDYTLIPKQNSLNIKKYTNEDCGILSDHDAANFVFQIKK